MCDHCSEDPRDQAGHGERALLGLRILLSELPPGSDFQASDLEPLVSLIYDKLGPAIKKLEDYVPRLHPAGQI